MKQTELYLLLSAAGLTLGMSGASHAAIYSGHFDPVDFLGDFNITISNACLLTNGWQQNSSPCFSTLNSISATIYGGGPSSSDPLELSFAPPAISSASVMYGVFIQGGELDSFDTDLIPFQSVLNGYTGGDSWWIQFQSGCYRNSCLLTLSAAALTDPPPPDRGVYLYQNDKGTPVAFADYQTITRLDTVPEPGSLALLLGALGAGLFTYRRRPNADT